MCNYKAWCKATNREHSDPRYSHNWVLSKRAWFRIYDNRIECAAWTIPKESIKKAVVYKAKQMFIPISVLLLVTENGSYQFGFNPWADPIKHLGIDVEEQTMKVTYSPFSIVIRVALVAYVAYWLWSEYSRA